MHDDRALLKKRILTLADYAKEVRRGVKLSKIKCVELYGSSISPIPVPLKGYESLDQYEARFVAWVQGRNVSFQELRTEATRERTYRLYFARQEANNYNGRRARALAMLDHPEPAIGSGLVAQGASVPPMAGQKREEPSDGTTPENPPSKRVIIETTTTVSDSVGTSRGEQIPPVQAISPTAHQHVEGELQAVSTTMPDARTSYERTEDSKEAMADSDDTTMGTGMVNLGGQN
jgi:hypothetical protein